MLVALRVKNFVLMDSLELRLEPGFNVLTGETGAGKSIVVGALSLVLGGRGNAEQVRPGADEAEVEALFDVTGSEQLATALDAAGVSSGGELVIRRVVQQNGRSRAYLNGRLCTAGELQALASELCDVASQHESVALTDPSTHLGYLDRFGRLSTTREALAAEVEKLEKVVAEIREVREAERGRVEREAFLGFQLQGIDTVSPRPGELEELAAERQRLRHAGRLRELTEHAAARLDQGEHAICDELAKLSKDLRAAADLDPSLEATANTLDGLFSELREIAREVDRYAERAEANPSRLSEIEDRMYRLEGLLRQHGPTIDDVIAARSRIATELEGLGNVETKLEALEHERDRLLRVAGERARQLSQKRREAGEKLGASIGGELADLGMGGARVIVDVAPLSGERSELVIDGARLGRDGIDRVEFLIAPNKGIEPRPLRKIASGGELSRALLALKRTLAESGPAGLYVFDEVDAGVGGAVADKIGRAIADVARHHQVLCITHLATIAAFADAHFVVSKQVDGPITKSTVKRVEGKERVAEVARMLAGAKVGPSALKAASEMLDEVKARSVAAAASPKRGAKGRAS
ncbi:DNA repair protein RecN [Polyangium mundeleinium]|uniref:DNA repair protein RecN n=1 Tax=Polyangium mundeleinium TaxID=2995306 RepID=A0ABT5ES83_9BACT|nr:DNA repair protein RecN [Polyangium mundeleinium]MDC0743635.1 DNA repair protein RecN [Polyangium mundeleinium]